MDKEFKFALAAKVKILGAEVGEVTGRAEYLHDENRYAVRYQDARGCAVETWWGESALSEA